MTDDGVMRIGNVLAIPEGELEYVYCRASGPGGQHVNVTDSAVQLRFNVRQSPSLPEEVRARLLKLAGRRVTADGWLLLSCQQFRRQQQNREAVREQLAALLWQATHPPRRRKATAVPRASKLERLVSKRRLSVTKRGRQAPRLGSED